MLNPVAAPAPPSETPESGCSCSSIVKRRHLKLNPSPPGSEANHLLWFIPPQARLSYFLFRGLPAALTFLEIGCRSGFKTPEGFDTASGQISGACLEVKFQTGGQGIGTAFGGDGAESVGAMVQTQGDRPDRLGRAQGQFRKPIDQPLGTIAVDRHFHRR